MVVRQKYVDVDITYLRHIPTFSSRQKVRFWRRDTPAQNTDSSRSCLLNIDRIGDKKILGSA